MLFCLFILYQPTYYSEAGCPPAGSPPNLPAGAADDIHISSHHVWILHSVVIPSCYKTNIKNWNLQVNLHLWSQYKKRFFNSFYFFLRATRIKLLEETFPRPLFCSSHIVRVRLVYTPVSSESSREEAHFSVPGSWAAGGVPLLWHPSCCFDYQLQRAWLAKHASSALH